MSLSSVGKSRGGGAGQGIASPVEPVHPVRGCLVKKAGETEATSLLVLSTIWANGDYDIWKVGNTKFRIRVTDCHQQVRRLDEGLGELACKPAGIAITETAARAINPGCAVRCLVCPPDEHPRDIWCEWEFEVPRAA